MADNVVARFRDHFEPAHPVVVERYDDLVAIYTYIREKYQEAVDAAFDAVSRQIGFVVTTTVPVVVEVEKGGAIKSLHVGAAHLNGTLFERIGGVVKTGDSIPAGADKTIQAGSYRLYLLWFDALNLKLRADWMEPAHFLSEVAASRLQTEARARIRPDIPEPAHWFDPGIALAEEEAVLISAIDQVYPEIQLANRVSAYRQILRGQVGPHVKEPAHFRPIE